MTPRNNSGGDRCQARHDDGTGTRLAGGVGTQGAHQPVSKAWISEQVAKFAGDVVASILRCVRHLADKLLAAVDKGDDVSENRGCRGGRGSRGP